MKPDKYKKPKFFVAFYNYLHIIKSYSNDAIKYFQKLIQGKKSYHH